MGPTGETRIVQVHPTRKCNLSCLHCYSSSSPKERDIIDVTLLCDAITDAAGEGYNVVSMSGGEPLLYGPLEDLLSHSRATGMQISIATNGMLLDEKRLQMVEGLTDLIAISLDGIPESHNRIRGHQRAFEIMRSRLAGLRESGIPFGFIFTLTQHNLDELDWVSQFAIREGAQLLQIHPLEEAGNAAQHLQGTTPDGIELAYACLAAIKAQERYADCLLVQIDVANKTALVDDPGQVYAGSWQPSASTPLSELMSPLIIEADGTVVPLQYGFSRQYAVGVLGDERLTVLADRWRHTRMTEYLRLCRSMHEHVTREGAPQFLNWYHEISKFVPPTQEVSFSAAAS